jgi:hypothetical protein
VASSRLHVAKHSPLLIPMRSSSEIFEPALASISPCCLSASSTLVLAVRTGRSIAQAIAETPAIAAAATTRGAGPVIVEVTRTASLTPGNQTRCSWSDP